MSCRIKPKEKYVCISMKEDWSNLELHSDFELSRLKVAQNCVMQDGHLYNSSEV